MRYLFHISTKKKGMDAKNETNKERTIFVGGIPLSTTLQQLKDYLSAFDKVLNVQMPRHKDSDVLKGYAKAVLATSEGIRRIVSHPSHRIGGLKVGIMQWTNKKSYLMKKDQEGERKVHARYSNDLSEASLLKYFRGYGRVEDISIRTFPGTNISRNFCYITFASLESTENVLQDSPHLIANEYVHCELSIRPINKNKYEDTNSRPLRKADEKKGRYRQQTESSDYERVCETVGDRPFDIASGTCQENEQLYIDLEESIMQKYRLDRHSQGGDGQIEAHMERISTKDTQHNDFTVGRQELPHVSLGLSEPPLTSEEVVSTRFRDYEIFMMSLTRPTSTRYHTSSRILVSRNHALPGNLKYKIRLRA